MTHRYTALAVGASVLGGAHMCTDCTRSLRTAATWAAVSVDYKRSLWGVERDSSAYTDSLAQAHQRNAPVLVSLCRQNGGVYVKAGQLASELRAIPQQYRDAFKSLQDRAGSRPFAEVLDTLRASSLDGAFAHIEQQPAAAASLAQVHRATLADGTSVAVKVQHAHLARRFAADLLVLDLLARAVPLLFAGVDLKWILNHLRTRTDTRGDASIQTSLGAELDFVREAANTHRLRESLAHRRDVVVPRTFPHLSSSKILTSEWCVSRCRQPTPRMEGCRVDDAESISTMGMSHVDVGTVLLSVVGEMVFCTGFVHADLHPGNVLVRRTSPSNAKPQVVLLDVGHACELGRDVRMSLGTVWRANGNRAKLSAVAKHLGLSQAEGQALPLLIRRSELTSEQRKACRDASGIGSVAEASAAMERLPRPFLLAARTIGQVRGIARDLGVDQHRRWQILSRQAASCLVWEQLFLGRKRT